MQVLSFLTIILTVVTKFLSLVRDMKVTEVFGVSIESDAYNIAYILAITLFGMFSAALSNSIMPIAAFLYQEDKERMKIVLNTVTTCIIILMFAIICFVYIQPNLFVKLIASGMTGESLALSAQLVKISIWSLVFLVFISIFSIILRIYDRNLFPTITEIIFPIPIIVALIMGYTSIYLLTACIVLGYFLRYILLYNGLNSINYKYTPTLNLKDKYVKKIFKMMLPLLLSSGLLQIQVIIDNQMASNFGVGSLTSLSLASKVQSLAYTVFSTSLMQIIYASMSKSYASGNIKEFKLTVKKQTNMILTFIIPCALCLAVYGNEVIEILFVRGNFTTDDAVATGRILKGYSWGLIFFVLRDICIYIYYSSLNSKFPTIISGYTIILNILLNIILSNFFGIAGIAYATSIAVFLSFCFLMFFMKKKVMKISLLTKTDLLIFSIVTILIALFLIFTKELVSDDSYLITVFLMFTSFVLFWILILFLKKVSLKLNNKI